MSTLIEQGQAAGNKKAKKRERTLADGNYPARVANVAMVGNIEDENYDKTGTEIKPYVCITFELPTKLFEKDGESYPERITRIWPYTLNEKAGLIIGFIKPVKPSAASLEDFLNEPLAINIGTTKGGNAKVVGCAAMMEGMVVPELVKPATYFDIETSTQADFDDLPPLTRMQVLKSEDNKGRFVDGTAPQAKPEYEAPAAGADEGDNPFAGV